METCKLCQKRPSKPNGVCENCLTELGARELPPSRRKPAPCTRCNGLKFVRVVPREYSVSYGGDHNWPRIAPMTLTQTPAVSANWIAKGNTIGPPSVLDGKGVLETYTCLGCGFVEWYCQQPEEIPIGPEYMSEIVDYVSDTPYR